MAHAGGVNEVVSNYLQSGSISLHQRVWNEPADAPGNEYVYLHRVSVKPMDGEVDEQITVNDALQLEFDFWNHSPGCNLKFRGAFIYG